MSKKRIAIFASGAGSNANAITEYFKGNNNIEICLIATNKADAGVLEVAKKHNIPTLIFSKEEFKNPAFEKQLKEIDFIVLAGFLWLIPTYLVDAFPNKIINIHPALLPKYGGKGMYGRNVHQAVFENKEKETGITIHFVNEHYDEGGIIRQEKVELSLSDTPDIIQQKVHELEHKYFPKTIEELIISG
ncbi:MAG TPA: phosphoribosylglycinamide formyltransferase [Chitinophagales bacterium]